MDNLFTTIALAGIAVFIGLIIFSIGWFLTGKGRIKWGACGKDPNKKDCDSNKSSCSICDHDKKK